MSKTYSVNGQIKARRINLVLSDGEMKESIQLKEALQIAEDEGMDVVEVSKNGKSGLPVCKIADYGKMMYDQSKKKKNNRKSIQHTKEIKYGLNIGNHDLEIKHKKIFKFLSKHYMVRYVLELNGREKSRADEAFVKMCDNLEIFRDHATWKEPIVLRGRRSTISTTLMPI